MKIDWNEMEKGCRALYKKIPKGKYDGIICIATGGLLPGKILAELMDLPLGIVSSKKYGKKREKIENWHVNTNIQWNEKPNLKSVLVVDDIILEGKTMQKVLQNLISFTSAETLDIAVLFEKKGSRVANLDRYKIYKWKDCDEWIVFPWEVK